jgi:hypothetical protein
MSWKLPLLHQHGSVVRLAIAIIVVIATIELAQAEEPSITTALSSSEAGVGEQIQLQIKVTGARAAEPPEISIDGLDIQSGGQMQSFEMRNFDITSSVTFNYTITPLRVGTFKIPSVTINAGGKSLRSDELRLTVTEHPNQSSTSGNRATLNPKDLASIELIIPKKNVYVGESVPIEVRLLIDTRARVVDPNAVVQGPQLDGQGLTVQKSQRPVENQETINGRRFHVVVYKTAITAAKAGKLDVGPARLELIMQWPRTRSRMFSPRDIFGMDDAFDGLMPNPFSDLTQPVPVKIASEPVTLEVKTLPPNAPPSFSGAIGNFVMTSDVNPKSGQLGDPFTVTTQITGRGNFDRVTAPVLEDDKGWRKYPPSSNFKQNDDVGISGTKTFETVLSPNERKEQVPPQLFTYFDSLKDQYVTLRAEAIPIRVEGGVAPTTAPPVTPTANAPATSLGSQTPAAKQQDILYQITELPTGSESFAPLFARRAFWFAQLVPLLALLLFIAWEIRVARLNNREMQRRETLQRESAEIERSLRRDELSPEEYFSRASRAIQLKTALIRGIDPNAVDAEIAAAAFKADTETRQRLCRLFERSDEARYSGATSNGVGHFEPAARKEVLELVEQLKS